MALECREGIQERASQTYGGQGAAFLKWNSGHSIE